MKTSTLKPVGLRRSRLIYALTASLFFSSFTLMPGAVTPVSAQAAPLAPVPANEQAAPEINAFETADRKQMPSPGAVLFMGSSSIRMWTTLSQDFPEIPVINRGFGGSLIQDSTRYAEPHRHPLQAENHYLVRGDK